MLFAGALSLAAFAPSALVNECICSVFWLLNEGSVNQKTDSDSDVLHGDDIRLCGHVKRIAKQCW